ncbi:negative regulation of B cell receptor signaling pathway [Sparganum proliferum]
MPHAITIERHKLNQGMYQKLKKFIMNKRKREAEERAQDDYYKRLRKEREERKRQTKLFAESLENTRREIIETRKRVEALKAERNALFTRLKQLSQATAMREKAKRYPTAITIYL